MKHIAIFENFTSFSDFQSIEKGQNVKYLGTSYEVINNDGYILELKDEEGKIVKVNYNMFKDKGYLPKYESASEITFKFTSRNGRDLLVTVQGGRITNIDNKTGIRFPFSEGQTYNRSIETWACNNNFKIDGKNPCPDKKVFGIKTKDIPKGHELRMLYPSKFRD